MNFHVGEDLRPELREIVVDYGDVDEAGVHHLEDVVVLEILRGVQDRDRRPPVTLELLIEGTQALRITARPSHEDFVSGQVLSGLHCGQTRRRDHDLADVPPVRDREVHDLLTLLSDGLLRRHRIDLPRREGAQEQITLHRHGDHMDSKIPGLSCRVELLFEPLQVRERQASLCASVHEIVSPVERDAHADHAARFHLVEIARERAADHRAQRLGKG